MWQLGYCWVGYGDHISQLLKDLHWLDNCLWAQFKVGVCIYLKCKYTWRIPYRYISGIFWVPKMYLCFSRKPKKFWICLGITDRSEVSGEAVAYCSHLSAVCWESTAVSLKFKRTTEGSLRISCTGESDCSCQLGLELASPAVWFKLGSKYSTDIGIFQKFQKHVRSKNLNWKILAKKLHTPNSNC